jgi:hypothetical protein
MRQVRQLVGAVVVVPTAHHLGRKLVVTLLHQQRLDLPPSPPDRIALCEYVPVLVYLVVLAQQMLVAHHNRIYHPHSHGYVTSTFAGIEHIDFLLCFPDHLG